MDYDRYSLSPEGKLVHLIVCNRKCLSNILISIEQNTFAMPVQEAMLDLIVKGAIMVTLETLYKLETIVSHVIVMGTEIFMKTIGVIIGNISESKTKFC